MPFMGSVPPGCEIGIRLMAADTNREPALLTAGLGDVDIEPQSPSVVVAPGTSRAVTVRTGSGSTVRVHVQFTRPEGHGQLEVRVNGAARDSTMIRGETWWTYAVETPTVGSSTGKLGDTMFYAAGDSRRTPRGP